MTAIPTRAARPRRAAAAAWLIASVAGGGAFVERDVGAAADRAVWRIDPTRTHIGFVVDAVGFPRTQGEFRVFDGRLSIDFDRPAASRVAFTVRADSIEVGSSSFDETLRGSNFLDAQRFADIRFVSTRVEKRDDSTIDLTGDLTLLGVTRPLTVEVEVKRLGDARLSFVAHARIDRLAYGMNAGFPIISRDVDLTVSSEALAG
jgi:polyisoprenoid-binding protein YceI